MLNTQMRGYMITRSTKASQPWKLILKSSYERLEGETR